MVFDALNVSLVASDAISGALRNVGMAAGEAGDEAVQAGAEFGSFSSALDAVDDEAMSVAVGNRTLAESIEDVGDEATQSSGKIAGFRAALSGLGSTDAGASLNAIPDSALEAADSAETLKLRLRQAQDSAESFADNLNALNGDARDAAADAIEASDGLEGLSLRLRRAGGDAEAAADDLEKLDESTLELLDSSVASATGLRTLRTQIDEAGDDARDAADDFDRLDRAVDTLDTSSVGLTGALGPVRGRISSVAAVAGAASVPLAGLATSLGGIAAGAGAAAGGIGLLSFGGLQREAERMAATNEDLKNSTEALEQIFANFGQEVKAATEPLQTAANTEFVFSGMEGFVELAGMASESVASITPELQALASSIGGSALENAPAIFAELETTVVDLKPALEGLGSIFDMLPGAIAFLREQGVQLAPALGGLAVAFGRATAGAGAFGADLLSFVIPVLSTTLNLLGWLGGVAAAVPDPLLAGAGAAVIAAAAMATYGGVTGVAAAATSALVGAIGTLLAPVTLTIAAIAALVGATVAVISAFGLWGDIMGALAGVWNGIVGAIEFGINTFLSLYDALGLLGPVLFPAVGLFFLLGDAIGLVGDLFGWLAGIAGDVLNYIGGLIDWIVEKIGGLIDMIDAVTQALGIGGGGAVPGSDVGEVDLGALEAGEGGDDSDDSGGGGGGGPPPTAPAPTAPSSGEKTTNNYDFSGADFGGGASGPTEVQEAVQEANREDRAREDGRSA